jgi:hypothetical protein
MYVRDSLKAIFSDDAGMVNKIQNSVIPGEYGLEAPFCRWVCLMLLGIQVQAEFRDIINMIVTIAWLPCSSKPWLKLDKGSDDGVKFFHGGVPCWMKVICYLIIGLRLFISFFVGALGVRFLLNTAAIADLIFNSLAITFIFDLDELIQDAWSTKEPGKMIGMLDEFRVDRKGCYTRMCDMMHRFIPLPIEGFIAFFFVFGLIWYNDIESCITSNLGGLASNSVYAIEYGQYSIFTFFQTLNPVPTWCPPSTQTANAACPTS